MHRMLKTLIEVLSERRADIGLSPAKLAAIIGKAPATIRALESGVTRHVSFNLLRKYAQGVGLTWEVTEFVDNAHEIKIVFTIEGKK